MLLNIGRTRPAIHRDAICVERFVVQFNWGCRSMSDDRVRKRVLEAMGKGLLPPSLPRTTWGGFGAGSPCSGCGKTITTEQLETEFEDGGRRQYHFHIQCFATWEALMGPARAHETALPLSLDGGYSFGGEQCPSRRPG